MCKKRPHEMKERVNGKECFRSWLSNEKSPKKGGRSRTDLVEE
jgi:hypothetical protein